MHRFTSFLRTPLLASAVLLFTAGSVEMARSQPFGNGADITTSANGAWSVYAADIDGDGDNDVLSASRFDDTIAWYQNGDASGDGTGSSWTRKNISTSASRARGVYAADIDEDGDQDVLSASAGDNTVTWFQNGGDANGDGDGTTWTSTDITTSADGVHSVVTADVDGDGDLDVLSASRNDDTVAWYRNGDSNGGGDGSSWTRFNITTSADGAISVYTADIDGDGDQDVLSASDNDDTIAWYRNGDASGGGDGSSWTRINITTSAQDANSVYAADIDSDGDLDVLSGSFNGTVAWHRNGDGSGGGDGSSWKTTDITTSAEGANRVYAVDIDADGDQDVFSALTDANTVAWFRNGDSNGGGDGSSWNRTNITTSVDEPRGLYVSDINGNSALDVMSASSNDDRVAWYNNQNTAIPVELAQFNVQRTSGKVLLTWETASEQNNAGFEVQRRVSGRWKRVSFVEGAGTTSDPQTYRLLDENLPYEAESIDYRLKQIDTDGTTTFSDTRTLEIGTPDRVALYAPHPNPANGQITLRYALPREADVSIRIYDAMGRKVTTLWHSTENAGRKKIQVSTSDLSSGTYFVRLQAGERLKTRRLTVVR